MPTESRRKASIKICRCVAAREEVRASRGDVGSIRALAEAFRSEAEKLPAIRASIGSMLGQTEPATVLDVFGSELPDEAFEGVFTTARTGVALLDPFSER